MLCLLCQALCCACCVFCSLVRACCAVEGLMLCLLCLLRQAACWGSNQGLVAITGSDLSDKWFQFRVVSEGLHVHQEWVFFCFYSWLSFFNCATIMHDNTLSPRPQS